MGSNFISLGVGETAVACLIPPQISATITRMSQILTQELTWARRHLPRLHRAMAQWPSMAGVRLACSIHLDLKMIPLLEGLLARGAQLFLTTCNPSTVQDEVVAYLDEIDVTALRAYPHETLLPYVEAFAVNGRTVYLLAGGAMFNLTAGWGDSLNAFDVTLAVMAAGLGHTVAQGQSAPPGVHILPRAVWTAVLA